MFVIILTIRLFEKTANFFIYDIHFLSLRRSHRLLANFADVNIKFKGNIEGQIGTPFHCLKLSCVFLT